MKAAKAEATLAPMSRAVLAAAGKDGLSGEQNALRSIWMTTRKDGLQKQCAGNTQAAPRTANKAAA